MASPYVGSWFERFKPGQGYVRSVNGVSGGDITVSASDTAYTPTTSANWSGVPLSVAVPATILAALDTLAAFLKAPDIAVYEGTIAANAHTALITHKGGLVRLDSGAGVAVTLPEALAVVGYSAMFRQVGSGQLTFAAGGAATLVNRQSHTKSAGQHAIVTVTCDETGVFVLSGDTAA